MVFSVSVCRLKGSAGIIFYIAPLPSDIVLGVVYPFLQMTCNLLLWRFCDDDWRLLEGGKLFVWRGVVSLLQTVLLFTADAAIPTSFFFNLRFVLVCQQLLQIRLALRFCQFVVVKILCVFWILWHYCLVQVITQCAQ